MMESKDPTSTAYRTVPATVPAGRRSKWLCAAAVALWAAGFVIWPGCATPPLPSSRTPVAGLQRSDVDFAKRTHPMRSEVNQRLGEPNENYTDLRVACYELNHLSRRRLALFLGVVPIGVPEDSLGLEVVMFQFDERDRLLRSARRTVRPPFTWFWFGVVPPVTPGKVPAGYFSKLVRASAEEWVAEGSKKQQ